MTSRTPKEIEIMRAGGALLSRTLAEVVKAVQPGVKMRELDTLAEKLLLEGGGRPSFKGFKSSDDSKGFPSTMCISVNDEVVHASGNRDIKLNDGDIVGLDVGAWYQGWCTDMAVTVPVGQVSAAAKRLLESTREALRRAISTVRDGSSISDIGRVVEALAKERGYGVVRDLVGHGVGAAVHEDPQIPHYYNQRFDKVFFKTGMTVAIEPMFTAGDYHIKTGEDGWAIKTVDGSLAAQFEVTVAVTEDGCEILTPVIDLDFG